MNIYVIGFNTNEGKTMKIHKSKRFKGIFHTKLQNSDLSYYITYRDADGKLIKQKIGLKSKGVNENVCNQIRNETIANLSTRIPTSTPTVLPKNLTI